MSFGSKIFMKISESQSTDSESSTARDEFENINHGKVSTNSGVKVCISSTTGLDKLLQCPVCTNSMYPPIHQLHCASSY